MSVVEESCSRSKTVALSFMQLCKNNNELPCFDISSKAKQSSCYFLEFHIPENLEKSWIYLRSSINEVE